MNFNLSMNTYRGKKLPFSVFASTHPAVVLSMAMFLIILNGIFYGEELYREFGINIFDYGEINDFVLFSLKTPGSMLLLITTFTICYFVHFYFYNKNNKGHMSLLLLFTLPLFLMTLNTSHMAKYRAGIIMDEKGDIYKVEVDNGLIETDLIILGSVEKFIFFRRVNKGSILAIAKRKIVYIEKT